jgi:hypothetical protein
MLVDVNNLCHELSTKRGFSKMVIMQEERVGIKLRHGHYLDKWLGLYELDHYEIWLFKGLLKLLRKYVSNGRILAVLKVIFVKC